MKSDKKGNIDFLKVDTVPMKLSAMHIPGYNPRKDIREYPVKYEQLHSSIKTIGYSQLLTVNKRNGNIVGGNQRYKVICDMVQDAGWKLEDVEIEVVLKDFTDAMEMAANSAYNNCGMENEEAKLAAMFEAIKETDAALLKMTGFEDADINKMIDELNGISDDVAKDAKPEPDKSAVFELKLTLPHQYFESYQDFKKVFGDEPLSQAVIQKIMGFHGGL